MSHYLPGLKQACVLLVLLVWAVMPAAVGQEFRRLYSGTRSEIIKIQMTSPDQGFYLSDRLNRMEKGIWERLNLTGEGRISDFYALSTDDFWYSCTSESSTSSLYHYHLGKIVQVRLPFANDIHAMFISGEGTCFFSSHCDVITLEGSRITKADPLPGRGYIRRIFGRTSDRFWVNTNTRELFYYTDKHYQRVLADKKVYDFSFLSDDLGFILCEGELIQYHNGAITTLCRDKRFESPGILAVSGGTDIWITNQTGQLFRFENQRLSLVDKGNGITVSSISSPIAGEVWLSGREGMLLYRGTGAFKPYSVADPGFAAFRPVVYGIRVDNEYGVAMADFNNDGLNDLFTVCLYGANRMFINYLGKETADLRWIFREEAFQRGVSGVTRGTGSKSLEDLALGVVAGDIDNDGDQDLYICSLIGKNKLFLNDGNGFFRDVSMQRFRACEDMKRSNAAVFTDADLDGDPDLFVTSEEGSNRFFENDGTGHFTDITSMSGLTTADGGMCTSACDINHDGLQDLCVTFWYPGNRLYLNVSRNGRIAYHDITYLTDLAGAEKTKSNAVAFADVNNDGHPDLFIGNRGARNRLYLNDGGGLFRDVTNTWLPDSVMLTNGAVFADVDLDGFTDLYITNVGANCLYHNAGGQTFREVTDAYGAGLKGYSTGAVAGDLDNDGDPDLYAANYINGNSMYFINGTGSRNSVRIHVEGTRSNRDATGAVVSLYRKGIPPAEDILAGYAEITGGGGYGSISSRDVIFAVDTLARYYAIIHFPATGIKVQTAILKPGTFIRIDEEQGGRKNLTRIRNLSIRLLSDREWRPEILKVLIISLLVLIYLFHFRHGPVRIYYWRLAATLLVYALFLVFNGFFLFASSVFQFLASPVLAITGLLMVHLITGRIMLKRLAEREKRDLRERLSRDLHDDLASTLGSISIYAGTLQNTGTLTAEVRHRLTLKITELTRSALQSITDIIWMTAPRNDTMTGLFTKINALMSDILEEKGIGFDFQAQPEEGTTYLPDRIRNNLFLILKEALHNIVRHSGAGMVQLTVEKKPGGWQVYLSDNGVGFDSEEANGRVLRGHGLGNMRRRAEESGIRFEITSSKGHGTSVALFFKI